MPDAKDNEKQTGDVHPPEVAERSAGGNTGRPVPQGAGNNLPDDAFSRDVENEGRTGKRVEQAGYLKDKDAPGLGHDDKG